jgi:integrase
MPRSNDIYQYGLKLKRKLESIEKSTNISKNAKKRIFEFQKHCALEGLSPARVLRYLHDLPILAGYLGKDFEKATKKDFEKVLTKLEKTNYAPQTKLDFKKTIKKFYKWLNGGEECPDSVKWIKTGRKRNNNKLPDELLTENDIKKLIEAASHPRDRAIISVLWESGCRAGELLTMDIKHVVFEDMVTRVVLQGKTGARRIPLLDSTPYLAEWINNHALRDNPDAPLWIGIGAVGRDKALNYPALRKMLAGIAKKAQIKRDVNPHNFRNSRATYLANHLTEAQMNQYLGWVRGSDMPATYVHLSGRDVDEPILKLRGLQPKEERVESTLASKKCPRCDLINKAIGKFCMRCGSVLDLDTAITMQDTMKEMDEKFSRLLQDEEIQKLLIRRMIELDIK